MMERALHLLEFALVALLIAGLGLGMAERARQAQVRATVCESLYEFEVLGSAIEAYHVDWDSYPLCNTWMLPMRRLTDGDVDPRDRVLERLSTPVQYLSDPLILDPFEPTDRVAFAQASDFPLNAGDFFPLDPSSEPGEAMIRYLSWDHEARTVVPGSVSGFGDGPRPGRTWLLAASGPDKVHCLLGGALVNFASPEATWLVYDPTNGTTSFGSLYEIGGEIGGPGDYGLGFVLGTTTGCVPVPELRNGLSFN